MKLKGADYSCSCAGVNGCADRNNEDMYTSNDELIRPVDFVFTNPYNKDMN